MYLLLTTSYKVQMGIAELKNQFMNYVFSDDDPKKNVERYLELCKYACLVQVTPATVAALDAVSFEMRKSDTREHRARLFTLMETIHEKRQSYYEKAIQEFQGNPGIITEPFYSVESDALSYINTTIIVPMGSPAVDGAQPKNEADLTKKRWELLCAENGIPQDTDVREYAIRGPILRQQAYLRAHPELREAAAAISEIGIPPLTPERLDRHPLTDKDGNKIDYSYFRERKSSNLKTSVDPEAAALFKGQVILPGSFPWRTSAYMDIGQADISKLSPEQQNSYLFLLDGVYSLHRRLKGLNGPLDQHARDTGDYVNNIFHHAANFCRLTRDSGPELDGVKAAIYGMALAFHGGVTDRVRDLERYLKPEVIEAGKQKAADYEKKTLKEKINLEDLEQDKPKAPAPGPNLWTEDPEPLNWLENKLDECTPEDKAIKTRLRKDFFVMAGKAAQTGTISEDIQNLREAIENEESDTLVSNERIQSCMDSHRRSIEKTWDQTFLSDKLTYLKLAQMRDLNQMLKKTDPALHINSSQFSALKTAMGRLVTMTDSRNLNLNNPAHRKQLSDQLGVIREACEAWLDKENTKTNRSNHQRYGMVLGILGCIDPLAAERKLIENRSPLKYNGEAIGPEEFRSMSYRPDGKSQSSAELLSQMVIRLAGTKYSGWTEKKRQEYYKRVVDRDLRREQNALKNPQKQERELIQTVNDPVQQRKHGKH